MSDLLGIPVCDTNVSDFAHRVESGVSDSGYRARPADAPVPLCARMGLPKELYLDRKTRREIWIERAAKKSRAIDRMREHRIWAHQSSTNQCWSFGPHHAVMIHFIMSGQKPVKLCPTFAACIVNDYRDVGGWGDNALDVMAKYGIPTVDEMPINIFSRANVEAAKPFAAKRKATEWFLLPDDWDGKMSLIARGFAVYAGYSKIGHETCSCDGAIDGHGNEVCIDQDSYTPDGYPDLVVRTERFGAGEDQGCPRVVDVVE